MVKDSAIQLVYDSQYLCKAIFSLCNGDKGDSTYEIKQANTLIEEIINGALQ